MNRIRLIALTYTCAGLLTLGGCRNANHEVRHWSEDVLLEDGTIVKIDRRVEFDETNALGGGTYNAIEAKATLAFTGELASLPVWDFPWAALVLYKSKQAGNWVIMATTSSCDVWWRNGKPIPMYWQYELVNNKWTNTAISSESIGKKTNLFYRYWDNKFPKHITVPERQRRQSDPGIGAEYREIVAEPPRACMQMK